MALRRVAAQARALGGPVAAQAPAEAQAGVSGLRLVAEQLPAALRYLAGAALGAQGPIFPQTTFCDPLVPRGRIMLSGVPDASA